MSKYSKRKPAYTSSVSTKSIVASFAVVAFFIGFAIFGFIVIDLEHKIPATSDEVWKIIEEQGYEPKDYTEGYHNTDVSFELSLIKCVGFEKDDIFFQFFEFNNEDNAIDIYGQAYQKITQTYNSWQKTEIQYKNQGYHLYFLDSKDKYNVAIYVENTAVYAYCDSENMNEIDSILDKIDYLTSGNNKKTE
ncbi:MAG: hypothetical protein IJA87_03125 [Clostridia bacterium]|nr:hypothetical protein [Clostridia bacterium]